MNDFYKKIVKVQSALKVSKNNHNSFGKYHYRTCEDILEALKPLLGAQGLFQFISDEIIQVSDRIYVKSVVTVTDGENSISATGMARESASKKGMDDSQLTGSTSSYARKYALNGLWSIDDAKDPDTNNFREIAKKNSQDKVEEEEYRNKLKTCTDIEQLKKVFMSIPRSIQAKLADTKNEMKEKLS